MMEMPKPGDKHKKLLMLTGKWEGEETMHPSPWVPEMKKAVGKVDNRVALDGFNVIQDYEQRMGDMVSFRGHGVFSFDQHQGDYVMHWFDNMGTPCNVFRGQFEGDTLTLTSQNPMGHSRATFELGKPGRYAFKMDFSQDGKQWKTFMEGSYTKKS